MSTLPVVAPVAPHPDRLVAVHDGKVRRHVPAGTPVPAGWQAGTLRPKKAPPKKRVRAGGRR
jgi:hypothetical protein